MMGKRGDILFDGVHVADRPGAAIMGVVWPPEVSDRHMDMARQERMVQIQTDAGEHVNAPMWRDRLAAAGRASDPVVMQMAELIAKTEMVREVWVSRLLAFPDAHPAAALVRNPYAQGPGF